MEAWARDGEKWLETYEAQVQHTFSRMNHHIHRLKGDGSEDRRVLKSCRAKDTKQDICKHGCP